MIRAVSYNTDEVAPGLRLVWESTNYVELRYNAFQLCTRTLCQYAQAVTIRVDVGAHLSFMKTTSPIKMSAESLWELQAQNSYQASPRSNDQHIHSSATIHATYNEECFTSSPPPTMSFASCAKRLYSADSSYMR